MNKTILLILITFILGFLTSFIITKPTPTGQVIEEPHRDYTYTTAICNQSNNCIDVLVECSGGNVIGLKPSSELVKQSENWEDFRNNNREFCE